MANFSLELHRVAKSFNRRTIFSDISFALQSTESLAVTGRNGSGKSTLLKIIAGIVSPSSGTIEVAEAGTSLPGASHFETLGFVAPYLQLYDEFTALENLEIIMKIRNLRTSGGALRSLLDRVGLGKRGGDLLRTYSSGMKQRVKYAAALAHHPAILLLDEPTSNLDTEGKAIVREIMAEHRRNGILIVATNETEELSVCERLLTLGTNAAQAPRSPA